MNVVLFRSIMHFSLKQIGVFFQTDNDLLFILDNSFTQQIDILNIILIESHHFFQDLLLTHSTILLTDLSIPK